MKCSSVFDKNIKAWHDGESLIFNQGGTRSTKTYSLLQLFFLIAYKSKKPLILSIVSYALPHLKLGAMRDFEKILLDFGYPLSCKNISESYYKIEKSIVEFFGVDNIGKVHGPERDYLLINECNFVKSQVYDQLAIRTRRTVFCDFNPSMEFWYHTEIQNKVPHKLIKSTYLDNEFLTPEQVERIEAKKDNKHWWQVYGLGELGRLEGAIYQNWNIGSFDNSLPFAYGLDFGVRDADALVKVAIDRSKKIIYLHEVIYKTGQSTEDLYQEIKKTVNNDSLIVGDSAATRTILDLKNKGLNIESVHKLRILEYIKMLKDFELIVSEDSINFHKELNTWAWLDKRGQIPADGNNHLIDATHYIVGKLLNTSTRSNMRLLY